MSEVLEAIDAAFARSVIAGLSAPGQKWLESKFLYDARGADLFDAICELEEYYPTRTEIALLRRHAGEVAQAIGPRAALVELGSGASVKSRLVLGALDRPSAYVPIDISRSYLQAAAEGLRQDFPDVPVRPVVADFTMPFDLPAAIFDVPRLLFFPGSTIGNFAPDAAVRLMETMRDHIRPDAFLVGLDLVKPTEIMLPAYDDREHVTAAFDLNILQRINRELGGTFELSSWRHEARFDRAHSRIEMHLVSRRAQEVRVLGRRFAFAAGETIHTENSYKFTPEGFTELAIDAGWEVDRWWKAERDLFALVLLRPDP